MTTVTPEARFNAYVHLFDDAGVRHAFSPGDLIPGWARPLIGEHVIAAADEAFAPSVDGENLEVSLPAHADRRHVDQDDDGLGVVEPPQAPPISGPGSGQGAWFKYARALGETEPTSSWSRQDIIDLLIRQGHITD